MRWEIDSGDLDDVFEFDVTDVDSDSSGIFEGTLSVKVGQNVLDRSTRSSYTLVIRMHLDPTNYLDIGYEDYYVETTVTIYVVGERPEFFDPRANKNLDSACDTHDYNDLPTGDTACFVFGLELNPSSGYIIGTLAVEQPSGEELSGELNQWEITEVSEGQAFGLNNATRSEERRVGKECRCRW